MQSTKHILMYLTLMFLIAGCSISAPLTKTDNQATAEANTQSGDEAEVVFHGTILEIEGSAILAAPAEGSCEASSSDQFSIPLDHLSESSPQPEAGDTIEVIYNGRIEELYPAQLAGITSIQVTKTQK